MKLINAVLCILMTLLVCAFCAKLQHSEGNEIENVSAVTETCICRGGICEKDEVGKNVCKCPAEHGLRGENECRECHCGKGVNCTISGSFFVVTTCICPEGYSSKFLRGCKGDCNGEPCKNGGTCTIVGDDIECQCVPPYYGERCERNRCKENCGDDKNMKCDGDFTNDEDIKCSCEGNTMFWNEDDKTCKDISSSTQTFSRTISRSTPLSSTTTTYTFSSLTEISVNDTEPLETTTYITNTAIPSSTTTSLEPIFTSGNASTSVDTNSTINLEINSTTSPDINSTETLSTSSTVNFTITTEKTSINGNDTERSASDEGSFTDTFTTESKPNITMIDWCASIPCQNGGYCRNRIDTFQCICTGIYGGQDCSENIFCELYGEDLCGREMCQYNDRTRRGYCVCDDGKVFNKASKTCIGSCSNYLCLNGGICKEEIDVPRCYCRIPFSGERCEKDPCTPSPCQNGASCLVDGATYKCFCKELHLGTNCEYDLRYIMGAVLLLVLLSSIVFCRGCHVYRPTQTFILSGSDGYKNLHNIP